MFATSVAYDLVFVVHVLAAVATIVVLVTMRASALGVLRGADEAFQRARFPERRNYAARVLHVLPLTGLTMSLTGDASVSLTRPWVGFGLLLYLAAAGHLEARTLPQERVVAEVVARDGVAGVERGRQLVRSLDVLLLLIALALVAMITQF